ncbi:hypothetical protein [Natrononativus amylolyticus]|uniref:hypothetical protein n=1 Tax=Natrononativus amylolyticus TaxID=2963434 RepID=UPI003CE4E037
MLRRTRLDVRGGDRGRRRAGPFVRYFGAPTFVVVDPESGAAGTLAGAQPAERFDEAIERIENAD